MIETTWYFDLFKNMVESWIYIHFVLCALKAIQWCHETLKTQKTQSKQLDLVKLFEYLQICKKYLKKQLTNLTKNDCWRKVLNAYLVTL